MGELLIVTGPPGAGKSTVAARLADRRSPSVLVAGDDFHAFLHAGRIDPWLPESNAQNEVVTRASAAATGRFAGASVQENGNGHAGYWTVFDGIVGAWFLPTFMAATELPTAHYVVLLPSIERCLHRVATRVGHGFSDVAAARHMHEQFANAFVDERHVLRDPPDDVDAVADEIMRLVESGQLRITPGSTSDGTGSTTGTNTDDV